MPQVDVGIVEGCVNNTDQEHELKMLRDRCKILIALGDCACTGNIPALRNQFTLKDCLARAYEQAESNRISCIPNDPRRAEAVPEGAAAAGGGEGGPFTSPAARRMRTPSGTR